MSDYEAFNAMEDRAARRTAQAENSTRYAWVQATVHTKGWGEMRYSDRISFGITYLTQPMVTYGFAIDDDDLLDTRFPRSCGFVSRWDQDKNNYYVGCYVAFIIETTSPNIPTVELDPNYDIDHFFTFSGTAMKTLNWNP